jgi:hypothetical protein
MMAPSALAIGLTFAGAWAMIGTYSVAIRVFSAFFAPLREMV